MKIPARSMAHPLLTVMFIIASLTTTGGLAQAEAGDDLTLDQLVDYADEVVIGEVTANASAWQGKKILTTSTVRVDEALKGEPQGEVEVVQLGGTAVHPVIGKSMKMEASGFASFSVGERVLLFLQKPEPEVTAARKTPRRPMAEDARQEARLAAQAEARRTLGERRRLVAGKLGKFTVKGDPSDLDASLPVGPKRLKMARDGRSPRLEADELRLAEMKQRIRQRVAAGRKPLELEGREGGLAR